MAFEVINMKRVFINGKDRIEDPDTSLSVDEVQGFLSVKYPDLTTATVSGPEIKGDEAIYTFKTTVGTKG